MANYKAAAETVGWMKRLSSNVYSTYVTISSMGGMNRIRKTGSRRKENINWKRRKGKGRNRKEKKKRRVEKSDL